MKKLCLLTLACGSLGLLGTGCNTVTTQTLPMLGSPSYARTLAEQVEILNVQPQRKTAVLGTIQLSIEGNPSKEKIELKLKKAAAALGADAALITADQTHVFPVVSVGWMSSTVSEYSRRGVTATALKYQ
jgi:hypothetical protein